MQAKPTAASQSANSKTADDGDVSATVQVQSTAASKSAANTEAAEDGDAEGTVQVQSTAASKSAANTETAEDGDAGASVQADTNMLSTTPVAEVSQNVAARKKVSKNVAAGYTNE
jgi:hypothetical protein